MKYRDLNDHEIIYLIVEGDEDAFTLMVEKYKPLIHRIIYHFRLGYIFDDVYQESVMTLHKSVFSYDPSFNKTFTRYLELNLTRLMVTQIHKLKRHSEAIYLHEKPLAYRFHAISQNSPYYEIYLADIRKALTKLEYESFILREMKRMTIKSIAKQLDCGVHQVYNALHRARLKIKRIFPEELDKDPSI
jgi:RNA polymerase sigma factor (sigma-70 family)